MKRHISFVFLVVCVFANTAAAELERKIWFQDITKNVEATPAFLETAGEPDQVDILTESVWGRIF